MFRLAAVLIAPSASSTRDFRTGTFGSAHSLCTSTLTRMTQYFGIISTEMRNLVVNGSSTLRYLDTSTVLRDASSSLEVGPNWWKRVFPGMPHPASGRAHVVVGFVAVMLLLPYCLLALGFRVIGVAAGSMAALFQSSCGTPLFFRIAQSVAMRGTPFAARLWFSTATVGAGVGCINLATSQESQEKSENDP